ncbi:MAG: hypothetical protein E7540_02190 [Ruminococcaceae bacterium]|nr:hypothetical protein [Oscillospiraceae bacterium]
MLNFIIGRACTGKSYQILERAAAASTCGQAVIIVPEQFSFETERAIIKRKNVILDNVSILSFSRLYDEVVNAFGRGSSFIVSDFEKAILIGKALKASADNLKVFNKYVNNREFLGVLSNTIRDFKFAGTNPEELLKASEEIGGVCGAKLHDISNIMSVYDALLENRYIDPSDQLSKLYDLLCEFNFFEDKQVFIDSFTGFTGQQYKIISKIIEQAKEVTFSFCTDNLDDESFGVFYNVNSSIRRIKEIAAGRGVKSVNVTRLDNHFYTNGSMVALEEFMSGSACLSQDIMDSVKIIACQNNRDEALAAANIISREVSENGYRFKDFIVVSRNAQTYGNYVLKQCENHNVSCFMDKSVQLAYTPLCMYLYNLLNAVRTFSTDNILSLLKLSLLDFSEEEISELEDYTFIWDIKSADWHNNWVMSVKGMQTDADSERDLERLKSINATREKVVRILSDFKSDYFGTPKQRSKAVYNHLIKSKINDKLSSLCELLEDEGDGFSSSIIEQSWDIIVSVLNSIVKVLDDKIVQDDEFYDAFVIATESATISNIPQMLDEVTFGSADRIRPSKPKISIILGANQGVFPASLTNGSGIFAESDKEKIKDFGINLDDDFIKGAIEENYLVYSMLCCPMDKVYVLYSKKSSTGEELEPSSFVCRLLDKFTNIKTTDFALSSKGEFVPRTAKSAFNEVGGMSDDSAVTVLNSLSDYDEYEDKIKVFSSLKEESDFTITNEIADKLFGRNIQISATKFDIYHRCSLSFLLKNGINLRKIEKADLNVLQRGTIVHYVLENIIADYGKNLCGLSPLRISSEVDRLINEYISAVSGSQILMTPRFSYLLDRISSSVKEIVLHIASEFEQSDFDPKYCELTIGENGDIPKLEYTLCDDSSVYLEGKIDRVDVYKNNVRVVDYKTGRLSFVLSDTLVGLNMQMLLYLRAFIKNGEHLVKTPQPAGILYMPARKSIDSKSLKMNGLISNDDEIVFAMEKENKGVYVPKHTAKSNDHIDKEAFDLIFAKIDSLITDMGTSIRKGEFLANPTDGIKSNACQYCDFASICRSSAKKHNSAVKYSNEEIINILKAGEDSGV